MSEEENKPEVKKKEPFWKARTKHGRDKIFSTPEILLEACVEYFEWCDNNPLQEEKAFANSPKIIVNLLRAYTLKGLCIFLHIDENTWQRYRKEEPYKDFWAVVAEVDQIIYTQKFTGASAGLLNSNIIARDLGLRDQTDVTTGGEKLVNKSVITLPNGTVIDLG